jgi:GNAT superfamily N-acetyltransferase
MIKETTVDHKDKLLSAIKASGQFDADGLEHFRHTLEEHLADPGAALWFTAFDGDPVGVAYCIPEPVSVGTWNLLMLWVEDGLEEKGVGLALVARIERELLEMGARILVVETSGTDDFDFARSFYEKLGFQLEATLRDFFDVDDDKMIYAKRIKRR